MVEASIITLLLFQLANLIVSWRSDYLGKREWNSDEKSTDGNITFDQAGDPLTLVNKFTAEFKSNGVEIINQCEQLEKGIENADKIESLKTSIDNLSKLLDKSMKGIGKVNSYNCFLSWIWYGILPGLMGIGAVCTIIYTICSI